jgi:hypothetical protein
MDLHRKPPAGVDTERLRAVIVDTLRSAVDSHEPGEDDFSDGLRWGLGAVAELAGLDWPELVREAAAGPTTPDTT